MRPVLIVVDLVLAQDLPQMGLVPDESWCPCGGRRVGVKSGWVPADADRTLVSEPVDESGAGALTLTGRALCFEHAGQNFGSRPRPPGGPRTCPVYVRRRSRR